MISTMNKVIYNQYNYNLDKLPEELIYNVYQYIGNDNMIEYHSHYVSNDVFQ